MAILWVCAMLLYLHGWWWGACCGAIKEVVVHQPLPEFLKATVTMPWIALQGQALQVGHRDEGPLLQPTEPVMVQMEHFNQAKVCKCLMAQPHQPAMGKVNYSEVWKLWKLVAMQGPETYRVGFGNDSFSGRTFSNRMGSFQNCINRHTWGGLMLAKVSSDGYCRWRSLDEGSAAHCLTCPAQWEWQGW